MLHPPRAVDVDPANPIPKSARPRWAAATAQVCGTPKRPPHDLTACVSAEDLIGTAVVGADGDVLAKVTDVLLDRTGRIFYVCSFGGYIGLGCKLIAMSADEVQWSGHSPVLVTDLAREDLENAAPLD